MNHSQPSPRLATPGIVINQDLLPHDWSELRDHLQTDLDITGDETTVESPIVIEEAIESLEFAVLDPGDTRIGFMVLATALRYKFPETHVRLTPAQQNFAVHCVEGEWATPAARRRRTGSQQSASNGASVPYVTVDNLPPADTHLVDELRPRSLNYIYQTLSGSKLAIDIPDEPLSEPHTGAAEMS
jgi:hypothetical protein